MKYTDNLPKGVLVSLSLSVHALNAGNLVS